MINCVFNLMVSAALQEKIGKMEDYFLLDVAESVLGRYHPHVIRLRREILIEENQQLMWLV